MQADDDLIAKLRALPPEGEEPDWDVLEKSIREAVGTEVPKPWWRRWQYWVPIGSLAVATAVALLWLRKPAPEQPIAMTPPPAVETHDEPAMAVWMDGRIIDLDDVDPGAIIDDDLDREAQAALATDETSAPIGGILPAGELQWIDNLDESALDRAERWLDKQKS